MSENPIIEEYKTKFSKYDKFTNSIVGVLENLLSHYEIEHSLIEFRTKSIESLANKIIRPEKESKYSTCSDLTDLRGIRIVTYLKEQKDFIIEKLRETFEIDEVNSYVVKSVEDTDNFGYRSSHMIVTYNEDRLKLPELSGFRDLKAEIQIRTVLEHAWAAIDWSLRYKNENEIPASIKRPLYRIAALLELADDEFSRVNNAVIEIGALYRAEMSANRFDVAIDGESLKVYFEQENTNYYKITQKLFANGIKRYTDVEAKVFEHSLSQAINLCELIKISSVQELDKFLADAEKKTSLMTKYYDFLNVDLGKPAKTSWKTTDGHLIILAMLAESRLEEAKKFISQMNFGPKTSSRMFRWLESAQLD